MLAYAIHFLFCLVTGPLVRIKQALTRLKQEVQQMDVRIGVVCVLLFNIYKSLKHFHGTVMVVKLFSCNKKLTYFFFFRWSILFLWLKSVIAVP